MEKLLDGLRDNAWNGIIGVITIIGLLLTGMRHFANKDNQKIIIQKGVKSAHIITRAISITLVLFIKAIIWLFRFPQGFWTAIFIGILVSLNTSSFRIKLPTEISYPVLTGSISTLFILFYVWMMSISNNDVEIERLRNKLQDLENEIISLKPKDNNINSTDMKITSSKDEKYYNDYRRVDMGISYVLFLFAASIAIIILFALKLTAEVQ